MEIITKAARGGKTMELVKRSHETGGYIVCDSCSEANRLFHDARKMGYDIPFPVTFGEFRKGTQAGQRIKCYLIDNADWFLREFAGHVPIAAITMTPDDPEAPNGSEAKRSDAGGSA